MNRNLITRLGLAGGIVAAGVAMSAQRDVAATGGTAESASSVLEAASMATRCRVFIHYAPG